MTDRKSDPEAYRKIELPSANGDGITVEVYFHRKYQVVPKSLDEADQKVVRNIEDRPFDIDTLLAYFEVKESGGDELVNNFDPPLELKVTYSARAWKKAIKADFERPRLAYLVWKIDSWSEKWIEFTKEITAILPPDTCDDPYGYIYLTIKELEDPLIGGC
ncbi:MAG: hypothetical protein ACC633_05635 [Anaerolineales bacterium]